MDYIDDVDAHFEQARSAGVTIWYEPQEMPYGQRGYGVRDPEADSGASGRFTSTCTIPHVMSEPAPAPDQTAI
ncbi:hypothetical protein MMA15_12975 [Streptomyces sp. M600PL45_2]|uniref:Glyoxalase/fosfomycin resistance/dioxygenase domain-containing protein n=1 Tax=Streptomyces marispadix TaxID=2922868 RepID=A0ABS9SYC8_9ACTN|nr:VOC family protein [Streptomyces marispadix]MCH6161277.1 hypothetical protein [Streptomyces marispadix]